MSHAKHLDSISGGLFFLGLFVAKLAYIPLPVANIVLRLLSPLCYLTAYTVWLISCQFYPDQPNRTKGWYNFLQVKNQHRTAALIGFIGMTLNLIAVFILPHLVIAGAWLFLISNTFWAIAEYQKNINLMNIDSLSLRTIQQNYYVKYALLITVGSFISALAMTLAFIFPPLALAINIISTILAVGVGLTACYFLYKNLAIAKQQKNQTITAPFAIPEINPAFAALGPKQPTETPEETPEPQYTELYRPPTPKNEILSPHTPLNLV